MKNTKKAYDNHHVRPAPENGYLEDTFVCKNVGNADQEGWVTTDWIVFNYCPLCGQELEDRQYEPEESVPEMGI